MSTISRLSYWAYIFEKAYIKSDKNLEVNRMKRRKVMLCTNDAIRGKIEHSEYKTMKDAQNAAREMVIQRFRETGVKVKALSDGSYKFEDGFSIILKKEEIIKDLKEIPKSPNKGDTDVDAQTTRKIILTNGGFTLVDGKDFEFLSQWQWRRGDKGYATRHATKKDGRKGTILMHRVINDTPDDMLCDHINGYRLDNRSSNLRSATDVENSRNKHTIQGKVPYKGVSKLKRTSRWKANITFNNETIRLGWFKSPEDAAAAYNSVAKILFGEFAWLNLDVPSVPDWQSKRIKGRIFKENSWESFLEKHPEFRTEDEKDENLS